MFNTQNKARSKNIKPEKNQTCFVIRTPFSEIDDCPEKILEIRKPNCCRKIKKATSKSPKIAEKE